jgi:hypothetical protein
VASGRSLSSSIVKPAELYIADAYMGLMKARWRRGPGASEGGGRCPLPLCLRLLRRSGYWARDPAPWCARRLISSSMARDLHLAHLQARSLPLQPRRLRLLPVPGPTPADGGAAAGRSRKISICFPISGLITRVFNCVRMFLQKDVSTDSTSVNSGGRDYKTL